MKSYKFIILNEKGEEVNVITKDWLSKDQAISHQSLILDSISDDWDVKVVELKN